jgi:hypothetical protein
MDFFILPGKVATLFIGVTMNLIINFQEPMELSGARENLLNVREVNKGKTFLIVPKSKAINTNLIFYNTKNKYMFYIKYDEVKAHDFVNVLEGKRDSSFQLSSENNHYRLLSGAKSVLIENKFSRPILVNGEVVKTREVFSKGIPLFVKVDGVEEVIDRRSEL